MSGLTEDAMNTGYDLPAPSYRATVRNGMLFITDWAAVLVSREKLRAGSSGSVSEGAKILDLMIIGEDGDELIAAYSFDSDEPGNVDQTLLDWAGHVGYRRVWLPHQVVDIAPSPEQIGTATLTCPTCSQEYTGDGPDFWLSVRQARIFPPFCVACGCEVPQWEVDPEEPSPPPLVTTPASIGGRQ